MKEIQFYKHTNEKIPLVEYLPEEGFVIAGSEKSTFKNPDVYCSFESDNEANGKGCAFKALTDPNKMDINCRTLNIL